MVHTAAIKERTIYIEEVREARKQSTYRRSSAPQMSESNRIISHAEVHAGNSILDLVRSTIWYPITLLICWTPNFLQYVMYIYVYSTKYSDRKKYSMLHEVLDVFGVVSFALGICYGVCAMLIFFGVKPEARIIWYRAGRALCTRWGLSTPTDMERHALGLPRREGGGKKKRPSATPPNRFAESSHFHAGSFGLDEASEGRETSLQYSVSSSMYSEEGGMGREIDDEYQEEEEEEEAPEERGEAGGGRGAEHDGYVYEDELYERASVIVQNIAQRYGPRDAEQRQGQQGAQGSSRQGSADNIPPPTQTPQIQLVSFAQLERGSPAPHLAVSPTATAGESAGSGSDSGSSAVSVLNVLHAGNEGEGHARSQQ